MKKLTAKQREALEWLAREPWVASWWGGKPHSGWPKQMPAQTYNSLSLAGLVQTMNAKHWSDRIVSITSDGRSSLNVHLREEP